MTVIKVKPNLLPQILKGEMERERETGKATSIKY